MAECQRIKEVHDQKVEGVLLTMTGGKSRTHMAIFFREWNIILLDKHVAESSPVAMEAARLREMHRADVRKLMYRMLDGQERANHSACCGVWKATLTDAKTEQQLVLAGQPHAERHDFIVEEAFLYWGD